jgi:hypothetical protein
MSNKSDVVEGLLFCVAQDTELKPKEDVWAQ